MKVLLVCCIFVLAMAAAVTWGGVWTALHTKYLPAWPAWVLVAISFFTILDIGMLLIESIKGCLFKEEARCKDAYRKSDC